MEWRCTGVIGWLARGWYFVEHPWDRCNRVVSRSRCRKVSKTILVSMDDEFIQLLYLVDTPRQVYPAYRLPSYDLRYSLLADVFSYCVVSAVFVALTK